MPFVVWSSALLAWLVFFSDFMLPRLLTRVVNPAVAMVLALLEVVRLCSKRVSLGLRLVANIASSKLLAHLLFGMPLLLTSAGILFWQLELLVAVLQAYIFITLPAMY